MPSSFTCVWTACQWTLSSSSSRARARRSLRRTLLLILVSLRFPNASILARSVEFAFDQVEEFIESRIGRGGDGTRVRWRGSGGCQAVMLLG